MQITLSQLQNFLADHPDAEEQLQIICANMAKSSFSYGLYECFEEISDFINQLENDENIQLNFNIDERQRECDYEWIITTWQNITNNLSKTIIWHYGNTLNLSGDINAFLLSVCEQHNEIDNVFSSK